jgi:hypothetical protein
MNLFAKPIHRLGATALDFFGIYVVSILGGQIGALVATLVIEGKTGNENIAIEAAHSGLAMGWYFWGFTAWFLNFGVMQGLGGSTFGKKLFHLKAVQMSGEPMGIGLSLVRTSLYWFSAFPFFLGFWAILFTKYSRAWHDIFCATLVLEVESISVSIEKIAPEISWAGEDMVSYMSKVIEQEKIFDANQSVEDDENKPAA